MAKNLLLTVVMVVAAAGLGGPAADARAGCEENRCNCVFYARCRQPALPHNLFTHEQKKAIINSRVPAVGSVAVHSYNHVSYVTKVETIRRPSGTYYSVTIQEANYQSCQITARRGSPEYLGIIGYYRP